MKYLGAPVPWCDVPEGAVVLLFDVPRTVIVNTGAVTADYRLVLLEGFGAARVYGHDRVQLVELDITDATLNLLAAGFTPVVIEET